MWRVRTNELSSMQLQWILTNHNPSCIPFNCQSIAKSPYSELPRDMMTLLNSRGVRNRDRSQYCSSIVNQIPLRHQRTPTALYGDKQCTNSNQDHRQCPSLKRYPSIYTIKAFQWSVKVIPAPTKAGSSRIFLPWIIVNLSHTPTWMFVHPSMSEWETVIL